MSTIQTHLELDPSTANKLDQFDHRRRLLLVMRAIAAGAIMFVAASLAIALFDYLLLLSDGVRWLLSLSAYSMTLAATWWFGLRHYSSPSRSHLARQLETADPRIREDLLSAVELADPEAANGSVSFRDRLQQSVSRRTAMLDIDKLLPIGLVSRWLTAGVVVVLCCLLLMLVPQMQFGRRIARAMLPGLAIERASLTEVIIIQPSPASGYVAEGDAVGVIVQLSGAAADDVMLRWRSTDGGEGETMMTPRIGSPNAAATSADENEISSSDSVFDAGSVFAANLAVGKSTIEYQIVAGDAITLWHELIPLPRPRVESFRKQYVFPSYAKLDDRIEEEEHGDLRALVGTMVHLTVRFDEPVDKATLRFGHRGVVSNLEPVSDSDREYTTSIPIKTPSQYQINAVSTRSGLGNPFSPQYAITPVIDAPPTVHWAENVSETTIVSPLDIVELAVIARDDLPMDQLIQEVEVNAGPLVPRKLNVEQPARELPLRWQWDLMKGKHQGIPKLSSGDIVRTRVIAIDRLGNRGQSSFIELLVAQEGFDSDRHRQLEETGKVSEAIMTWTNNVKTLFDSVTELAQQVDTKPILDSEDTAKGLHAEVEDLLAQVKSAVSRAGVLPESGRFELIGRGMIDLDQELSDWYDESILVIAEEHLAWQEQRQKRIKDLAMRAKSLAGQASQLGQYVQAAFAEDLSVALTSDVLALEQTLTPIASEDSKIPADRLPRYLIVALGRMEAVGDLIFANQSRLPESTLRHLENWNRWSDTWSQRLRELIDTNPEDPKRQRQWEQSLHQSVKQWHNELSQKPSSLLDGRIAAALTKGHHDLKHSIDATHRFVDDMKSSGKSSIHERDKASKTTKSEDVAIATRIANFADADFVRTRDRLIERLAAEEALHRARPHVDLQFAADMNLMSRAIDNVDGNGFAGYHEESASEVHDSLSRAYRILESLHEAQMWRLDLQELLKLERKLEPSAETKFKHPSWIESFSKGIEWSVRQLQQAGVPWEEINSIDQTRYGTEFQQANRLLTSRRWNNDPMLSAEVPLQKLVGQLGQALDRLEPRALEARQTIAKYVMTLPEQAREAAEKAEKAQVNTEKRANSTQQTTQELADKQKEAEKAASETIESLVDLANTAEITDQQQRALARDADAAAAQIRDKMEQAQEAMQKAEDADDDSKRDEALADSSQALGDLASALQDTAEHFERAENGEDVSESREKFRQAEEELQIAEQLEQRFERAKAMADAAQRDPKALLEQLERELQRNQPMQQKLSEIAERTAQNASQALQQAARDESQVGQSLERSDAAFQERKRMQARQLQNLSRQANSINQSLLNAAARSIESAETPQAKQELQKARQELQDVVDTAGQMAHEHVPLEQLGEAARKMAQAVSDANQRLAEIAESEQKAADTKVHKDEKEADRKRKELERFERDARNQRIQEARRIRQAYSNIERDSGRRVSDSQRKQRDVERRVQELESRHEREENNREAIEKNLKDAKQQLTDAQRAEQAARESHDLAKELEKQASEREKQLQRERLEKLKKANPSAELTERMAEKAKSELEEIGQQLAEIANESDFNDQLRAPEPQTRSLASQQQQIAQQVADVADQLDRAARHEQRLNNEEASQQLKSAAETTREDAAESAEQATEAINQAAASQEQSPQANQKIAKAESEIGKAAQELAERLGAPFEPEGGEDGQEESQGQQADAAEERAEQLAQTLDDLDRATHPSQAQADGSQESPNSEARNSETGNSEAGESSAGKPQSAAQASPTLAAAMEAQNQRSARQRRQQQQGNQPGQDGEANHDSSQSGQASTDGSGEISSGLGNMPDGGSVDISGIDRGGDQWGKLRSRRTEDATESTSTKIAPQYRREIEAYFRVIAKKAAEGK